MGASDLFLAAPARCRCFRMGPENTPESALRCLDRQCEHTLQLPEGLGPPRARSRKYVALPPHAPCGKNRPESGCGRFAGRFPTPPRCVAGRRTGKGPTVRNCATRERRATGRGQFLLECCHSPRLPSQTLPSVPALGLEREDQHQRHQQRPNHHRMKRRQKLPLKPLLPVRLQ